jgi:4-alpha-glucanotransferase
VNTEHPLLELQRLAEFCGLETAYYDGFGQYRQAAPEAVLHVLRSLGTGLERIEDAGRVLEERRLRSLERMVEPVVVWWLDRLLELELILPASREAEGWLNLECEDGNRITHRLEPALLSPVESVEAGGARFRRYRYRWAHPIAVGCHELLVEAGGISGRCRVFAAPRRAVQPEGRRWGLFLPLYALHTAESRGIGDFTDLQRFMEWTAASGGSVVGTLPLFASYLEEPCAPSPYTPVSRLFWNELFLDPRRCLGWDRAAEVHGAGLRAIEAELAELGRRRCLDYRRLAGLRRRLLEPLAELAKAAGELDRFAAEVPEAGKYASFRAQVERAGADWRRWSTAPPEPCGPPVPTADYHLYVQLQARQQIRSLLEASRRLGTQLYLDLPLGVHPDGFDAWRWPDTFAAGVSGGAPPDGFFTAGQDWGFQPLHPERAREDGYAYFRIVLGNLARHASIIRLDHAMSLQRLYWVPHGMSPREGLYVHYRTDELLALLLMESARHGCVLVGEDLGTVTPQIREKLEAHGVQRMYVGQFEFSVDRKPPFHPVPRSVVASLNTHDTPTAAGFWHGDDIEDRVELGLLTEDAAAAEREARRTIRRAMMAYLGIAGFDVDPAVQFQVLLAWLQHLAESEAALVLVTLEDLLQERAPQNVPGTVDQRPNWRRRARLPLEGICSLPQVVDTLQEVDRGRRRNRPY